MGGCQRDWRLIQIAYTKIFGFNHRLDHKIAYILNPEKTIFEHYTEELKGSYIQTLTGAMNCMVETAYADMLQTKERYGKTGGRQGYHFIQSFSPKDNITPETAHQIAREFAEQFLGDRFEVVYSTHIDHNHVHNHFICNSVSFADGLKYHSDPASYFNGVRKLSDELCRKYGLSIIEPPQDKTYSKQYGEWKAEKEGRQTWRGLVKTDIENALDSSVTFNQFIAHLKERGYTIREGRLKYLSVKPPLSGSFIRLKSLDAAYTNDYIKERLYANFMKRGARAYVSQEPEPPQPKARVRFTPPKITRAKLPKKIIRLQGLQGTYFYYLYDVFIKHTFQPSNATAFYVAQERRKLDGYISQFEYLRKYSLTTLEQVRARRHALNEQMKPLYTERKRLRNKRQPAPADTARLKEIADGLKALRKEAFLCVQIEQNSIRRKLEQLKEYERKEEPSIERRRTSSRSIDQHSPARE